MVMNREAEAITAGRIFHLTDNHSPAHPGVTAVVTQISRYLAGQDWPVTVLAAGPARTPVPAGVGLVEFPLRRGSGGWRYPVGLATYLHETISPSDCILHLHGVWGAPQWLGARFAARRGVAAILSAHDMLNPWHWRQGWLRRVKKQVYWRTLAHPAFRRLTVLHAITPQERDYLARQFPEQRLEVIPNAVDLQEVAAALAGPAAPDLPSASPYLLFLGRLHAKKGVDLLIEAFARAGNRRDFHLVIVGPDDTLAYTRELKARVQALGLAARVVFPGPVFGAQKWHLYRRAWAFCLPSHSEVAGLVNLEAAATGTPVITTHETGLYDWEQGGGLLIHPRVEELTRALEQVFAWTERDREDRGRALRELVARRYSWEVVGPQWLKLYGEIL